MDRPILSIISSLRDDLSLVINNPAALKHLSDSTEDGGNDDKDSFRHFRDLGISFVAS